MIASGANVKTVQSQLGHKTATMTLDQYGHLFPDDLDDVADKMATSLGCAQNVPKKGAGQGTIAPDRLLLLWSCRESNPGPTAFPRGFSVRSSLGLYSDLLITRTSQDNEIPVAVWCPDESRDRTHRLIPLDDARVRVEGSPGLTDSQ